VTTPDEDFIVEQDQTVSTTNKPFEVELRHLSVLNAEQLCRNEALELSKALLSTKGLLGTDSAVDVNDLIKLATWILDGSDEPLYPFASGDVVVLGPQVFASSEGNVINWLGANYNKQEDE